ncbi:MAG: CooT family nickel-binding protein [Eubacterium sp.]|nr:CooT family nickel-binding protein [Eubacterium sp.]MBQ8980329.1 CooT family nickel-binding protein [Eubacterium sp.]MBR1531887.1 CooT family nickel-binding protein [Eubacterium sp.]MBR2278253.1 CooT family nickel-binding protein [Eubacterium sp.]
MCLSTAYKNEISDSTAIMNNVMTVECSENQVTLIDLMGRRLTVDGTLLKASLTDGFVILKTD